MTARASVGNRDRARNWPARRRGGIGQACVVAALALAGATSALTAAAQQGGAAPPTPQQRAAMLQEWLKASQARLRTYQWIETTVVTKDGQEKSRKQDQCYYGADGKLVKIPMGSQSSDSGGGPLLGRALREAAKEDMEKYLKQAGDLVHSYVPPDSARIHEAVAAGNFAVSPQGQQARLDFQNYLKQGDKLSIDVEVATSRLTGIQVSSYLDDPQDAVTLAVTMGVLPDGTIYPAQTVLDAKAKGVTVTVDNSGYRPLSQ